ncbi:glycosyltransferase family 2 protein [Pedobacter sp. P351]|uniref:glycosyltransferase family 2 protein n=1 Tax=Pedobacter superstes TaxID=3133441 RepID=UPI00309588F7
MISIVILTKNEELDIRKCLMSVEWSDDVHVLDSGSTDRTIEISTQLGAHVSTNPFESFGKQRNFALDNLDLKNDWILFLDADEIVTDKFRDALLKEISTCQEEVAGFYCCWKMILEDKWLRYCDNFPKWQFRLMRKNRARFTDFGHGQKEAEMQGIIKYLKEPYIHYGFSKGWHHWVERHNRYSSLEATARLNSNLPFKNIFSRHGSIRNPALKSFLSRLPGWPLLRFFYSYFLKLGFLEGRPGLTYCLNMTYYEFLIQIKMKELKRQG